MPIALTAFIKDPKTIAVAIGFLLAALVWSFCPELSLALPFLCLGAEIDLRERRLPDNLVLPALGLACIGTVVWHADARLALLGIATAVLSGTALRIIRSASIGGGDVKALAVVGAAGGFSLVLFTLLGMCLGMIVWSILRRGKITQNFAAGPWIVGAAAIGAVVQYFWVSTGVHI